MSQFLIVVLVAPFLLGGLSDNDADGFPDVCELKSRVDRSNFRSWFALICEGVLLAEEPMAIDCADLVRYAYREALMRHGEKWFSTRRFPVRHDIEDVSAFNYPEVPAIGTRIFRTRPGPFSPFDLHDSTFCAFADAKTLLTYNTRFLGRDPGELEPGDLLFFLHGGSYHTMIYLGDGYLIYHTGPDEEGIGKVKKVGLKTLLGHPDETWHPRRDNPYFLGFYRWKILD